MSLLQSARYFNLVPLITLPLLSCVTIRPCEHLSLWAIILVSINPCEHSSVWAYIRVSIYRCGYFSCEHSWQWGFICAQLSCGLSSCGLLSWNRYYQMSKRVNVLFLHAKCVWSYCGTLTYHVCSHNYDLALGYVSTFNVNHNIKCTNNR